MKPLLFNKLFFALAVSFSTGALASAATTYTFAPDHGKVTFVATGRPKAMKIHGEGAGPSGTLTESAGIISGTLQFQLEGMTTGIALRDKHMKEKYLEVSKYPDATLSVAHLKIPGATFKELPFEGVLKVHGQEKPVHGTVSSIEAKPSGVQVTARFPIKLTDFAISIPSYLGITVAEDVDVQVESTLQQGATP